MNRLLLIALSALLAALMLSSGCLSPSPDPEPATGWSWTRSDGSSTPPPAYTNNPEVYHGTAQ